jgi:hypothetical protein
VPEDKRRRPGCSAFRSFVYDAVISVMGLMEGEAEDLHAEVDVVATELTIGPVRVAVLDDVTGSKLPSPRSRRSSWCFCRRGNKGASRAARICSRVQRG